MQAGFGRYGRVIRETAIVLLLAAIYASLGTLMLQPGPWEFPPAYFFYPPGGIIFGVLFLRGRHLWPAAAIGAGIVTYATGGSPVHIVGTAIGNAAEPLVALAILARWGFDGRRGGVKDVALFLFAAFGGAAVSAVLGAAGLWASGGLIGLDVIRVLWMWILSHWLGVLLVGAPFVFFRGTASDMSRSRSVETIAMHAGLALTSQAAFSVVPSSSGSYPLQYLTYPFLIWAALRLTPFWVSTANVVLSGSALAWTALGVGPFVQGDTPTSLFYGAIFSFATWFTTLTLAAIVSERRTAEAERRKRDGAYQALVEQAADGIFVLGPDGECQEINTAAGQLLGLSDPSSINVKLGDHLRDDDRTMFETTVARLPEGSTEVLQWVLDAGGEDRYVEASVKRLAEGKTQVFARDVTQRKQLEKQLNQSQKMEAVGLLAGGVAHDFNNQLTIIMGHGSRGLQFVDEGSEAAKSFRHVVDAASKSAELTVQLLTFARSYHRSPKIVDVSRLIKANEPMIRQVLGEDVRYSNSVSVDQPTVMVDPVQLEQVFLNLVINAKDSMPAGGSFSIATSIEMPTRAREQPSKSVVIRIRDSGMGMDRATASRAFEPFFSTKANAKRTGLGLAVSYGIIHEAGGTIDLRSRPGEGTTFEIALPWAEGQPGPDVQESPPTQDGNAEHILVVEDNPLIRDFVASELMRLSYRVTTAKDGESAIEESRRNGPIDLLLCDVVLPGISGPEAVDRIREHRPDVHTLFMSGYDQDRLSVGGHDSNQLLRKPFTAETLAHAVREQIKSRCAATSGVTDEGITHGAEGSLGGPSQ